ncbi:MAG: DUF1957 domain-containing protein [Spirochaetaceae bacterium]|jgi:1,4-alpha-glucan branching enzyme|nr:DUF1957 domain-containing protein [Spirochaetaceae bacterium]
MNKQPVIALALNAHTPFIRRQTPPLTAEDRWFFEALSETYLPLLDMFDRLDAERIHFRLGISLSPTLCAMLGDELLLSRYEEYLNAQIDFGLRETERLAAKGEGRTRDLAERWREKARERLRWFSERYKRRLLPVFDHYQRKGRLEILMTAATYGFLPFYTARPEAIQAQFEVAIALYRQYFGKHPQGFWLPELGWDPELDRYLRAYNFGYTIVNTHALVLGEPAASKGSFYPVKTPRGVFVLARDYYAHKDIVGGEHGFSYDKTYRDNCADAGYELSAETVAPFLGPDGCRTQTGYKYKALSGTVYDPKQASELAARQAAAFLESRVSRLAAAQAYMSDNPISLAAYNADTFGRLWHEGPAFLEALFREGAKRADFRFMTPAEYLYKQDLSAAEVVTPCFSSAGYNGYAETWLDASNDWIYRHTVRSLERMTEIAGRFPNETGIKERALNQAAREILLSQSSDWTKLLYKGESAEYARAQIEESLRNFTTIYEALGSNYLSTEWLTGLERRHNIFPAINYRVFRRKR